MRFVLVLALLCLGAECEQARLDALDAGRMKLPNGIEMRPIVEPWVVVVDESIELEMVVDAVAWWNYEAGVRVFEIDHDASPWHLGVVDVSIGYAGGYIDEGVSGVFIDETNANGEILRGAIVVFSEVAYHEATVFNALLHEMGHALGLADDPHSLDLNSIMSSPLIVGGGLTDNDRGLVVGNER